ncbi:hypothetical protein [Alkanindiges illinoisensis]|uniref:Uncharacterized protein n=1 Tax=Alkanindiges illinoisensis TaxID=197183 RepID=A0A4Y7XFJ7_9GAMM|nr:hypothetical protein [Alkanindiges illinoisensis]TEU30251.1 hypothetical protein E2B99_02625 [Alkanindiges illinoisensis]
MQAMQKNTLAVEILKNLIVAIITSGVIAAPRMATFFIFVMMVIIIGLPYWLYTAYKIPEKRLPFLINSMVWAITLSIALGVHTWRAYVVSQEADIIIFKIQKYEQKNGLYPKSIEDIGLSREYLRKKLGMSGYSLYEPNEPHFIYADTRMPFATYSYDFAAKKWLHQTD